MLNEKDLTKLSPYFAEGKVVSIDVKDRNRKGREVMLEYEDGRKLVGNLDDPKLVMTELKGLTSIASYFARGKYGSNSWRGNCSGLLIRDLLRYYQPDTFADLAVGSGTSIEVAKDLGYTTGNSVFSDLNPKYGGVDITGEDLDFPLVDFIFFHPPYYVFPGSSMPVYSGKKNGGMWGDEVNPHDGSRISDQRQFKDWFDTANANLYKLLRKGGRLAVLMGDSKYRGQYYSMFKNMNIFGDLEQVIIKQQHNCLTDSVKYSGKFIPTVHEYLVIIKKNDPYIVPVTYVGFTQRDMRKSTKCTWASVIAMMLEANGGEMQVAEVVSLMEKHPKAENNNHIEAKLRQELHLHPRLFSRNGNKICLASPAA